MQFVKITKNRERRKTVPASNYSLYTVSLAINVRWSMQTNVKQIAANYRRGPSSPTFFYVLQVYGDVIISIRTGLFMPESKSVSLYRKKKSRII